MKGLSVILDLDKHSAGKSKYPAVWRRGDFAPVLGLARGQLASEGCITVVTDGGRALPARYLPDVQYGSCQLGVGGCCTSVERYD